MEREFTAERGGREWRFTTSQTDEQALYDLRCKVMIKVCTDPEFVKLADQVKHTKDEMVLVHWYMWTKRPRGRARGGRVFNSAGDSGAVR